MPLYPTILGHGALCAVLAGLFNSAAAHGKPKTNIPTFGESVRDAPVSKQGEVNFHLGDVSGKIWVISLTLG